MDRSDDSTRRFPIQPGARVSTPLGEGTVLYHVRRSDSRMIAVKLDNGEEVDFRAEELDAREARKTSIDIRTRTQHWGRPYMTVERPGAPREVLTIDERGQLRSAEWPRGWAINDERISWSVCDELTGDDLEFLRRARRELLDVEKAQANIAEAQSPTKRYPLSDELRTAIFEAIRDEDSDAEHDALLRVGEVLGLVEFNGALWSLTEHPAGITETLRKS